MKVGFVGLGSQGAPMAQMIQRGGFDLFLWARRRASLEPFEGTPATPVDSSRALGERCDLVGVCVVNDADVEQVVLGDGILSGMKPGGIVAIHSTIHPDTCRRIAAEAEKVGVSVLDAPVSGSGEAAYQKRLTVMVGGDEAAFQRGLPVFQTFGEPVRHLGGVGAGQLCKLVNNLSCIANMRVAGEVLAMGRALGIEQGALVDILLASSGQSFSLDSLVRLIRPQAIDHVIGLFGKDLDLLAEVARAQGVSPMSVEEIARDCLTMLDADYR
jgi:3-hydroxyisobutyrate dehydrogenase-like beta-hydroxyacid dehydrogenase